MTLRNRSDYNEYNIFFITTTCNKWISLLRIGNSYNILSDSLNYCCEKYESHVLGYVFMPNHIHMILYFSKSLKRSDLMRDFKKYTSTQIRKEIEQFAPNLLEKIAFYRPERTFKVWQDRFDEVYLESCRVLEIKLDYIHLNPLQQHWRLCNRPEEYPYSSSAYYEKGINSKVKVSDYRDYI